MGGGREGVGGGGGGGGWVGVGVGGGGGGILLALLLAVLAGGARGNPDARRLYDDLLSNYNRLIRPVGNNSDRLTVKMGLRLSQLIDVNLKNQIMTTNVWVEQEWNDYKLKWNPEDYGGVETLHVPSEHIWLPDIVLYNNADGNYEVTIMTKAILHHTGKVTWKPPAIYKSFCEIDVEYFPFDEQTCFMKFGSWTYDGYLVDLRHIAQRPESDTIDVGIDLQDYYLSVEWDIMRVPAVRNEKFYSCCEEPYPDIIFNITLRRKTLFYTVNLIIPCVGISFLSVLVFYLPSDSGEKVSLCISILLSLTVFFLLLAEIIPPTSITVPLLGKYLLFTMVLVTLSVVVTIAVLNVNFRSPVTHKMAPWVHRFFIQMLPKVLFIERPQQDEGNGNGEGGNGMDGGGGLGAPGGPTPAILGSSPAVIGGAAGLASLERKARRRDEEEDEEDEEDEDDDEEPAFTDLPDLDKYSSSGGEGFRPGPRFSGEFDLPAGLLLPPPPAVSAAAVSACLDAAAAAAASGAASSPVPPFVDSLPPPGAGPFDEDLLRPEFLGGVCGVAAAAAVAAVTGNASPPTLELRQMAQGAEKAIEEARFIAQHVKNKDKFENVEEDWKYVAMVLDRLFLWIFTLACVLGTALIILQAPSLYDTTKPIDIQYSKVAKKKMMMMMMGPEEN
ncbi:acetylcholine receptor subunit alpha-like 1 [Hetaerina americana]|uniref:acetylcholine receptor subunit alpha-like 1 n=1 Tax=Hetaerina americana TaxID=62018 RepID=UPI003A7F4A42